MSGRARFAIASGVLADTAYLKNAFSRRVELVEVEMSVSPPELASKVAECQGIIVGLEELRREHFAAISGSVAVVGRLGIGLDTIDLDAAEEYRIAVIHQPNYGTKEVANHAMALLLATQRNLFAANEDARGPWRGRSALGDIHALDELSLGVVGCGRIGMAVISRARPFFREVVVYDPLVTEVPDGVVRVRTLNELLQRCACVTLHIPLTPKTRNLISAAELAMMPSGSVLINVSRGGLIDEAALVNALASGQIAGAGLDVLSSEPPSVGSAVLEAPNVVLTPHVAWYSLESEARVGNDTIADMIAYLEGREVTGRVAVGGAWGPGRMTP